jgi:hypothetical protein
MNTYNSTLLIIFGIIGYIMIVDKNVADYFILLTKIIGLNVERLYWMIRLHPKNFVTTWISNQKYDKIARQMHKEFQDRSDQ